MSAEHGGRRRFLRLTFASACAGLPALAAQASMRGRDASSQVVVPHTSPRTGFFARHQLDIGLQLYTLADAARTDLEGTFGKIARIGYRSLELAGFHGHDPQSLRAAADRAGLRFTSIHVQGQARGTDPGLDGDLAHLAQDLRILGITNVVMPMFLMPASAPGMDKGESFLAYLTRIASKFTLGDWQRTAAFLNEKSAALKREGLRLGYHNHNPEFAPLKGTTGFEVLLRETDAALVSFEMDAGWVVAAGIDPASLLKQYPKRFRQMHVKDIDATTRTNYAFQQNPTEVGRGKMDWKMLLPAAYAGGIRQFFVEQEPPFALDRFDAVAASFAYLDGVR